MSCFFLTRPLAGIMVLINYDRRRSMLENMSFPSPCGDYGSYLRHFSRTAGRKTGQVSVPLRGLWFLSNRLPGKRRRPLARFRPLAGIMVLISQDVDNDKNKYTPFPSPCGDYGSYQLRVLVCLIKAIRVSVPLRGLWFLSFEIDIDDE